MKLKLSLYGQVVDWASKVGIIGKSTAYRQAKKLQEEAGELVEAIGTGDPELVKMELGDIFVVANILAFQVGTTPDECLEMALNKIRKRKGRIVNGFFVSE